MCLRLRDMCTVAFRDETHTLASMLRTRLEANHPDDFVACEHAHPLDTFFTASAPQRQDIRVALLELKDTVRTVRTALSSRGRRRPRASG